MAELKRQYNVVKLVCSAEFVEPHENFFEPGQVYMVTPGEKVVQVTKGADLVSVPGSLQRFARARLLADLGCTHLYCEGPAKGQQFWYGYAEKRAAERIGKHVVINEDGSFILYNAYEYEQNLRKDIEDMLTALRSKNVLTMTINIPVENNCPEFKDRILALPVGSSGKAMDAAQKEYDAWKAGKGPRPACLV